MQSCLKSWRACAQAIQPHIFPNVCRTYILPSDLEEFLAPQEVDEAFHMLDENGNGKVSLHEIRDAVINIFNERRNLATSLKVLSPSTRTPSPRAQELPYALQPCRIGVSSRLKSRHRVLWKVGPAGHEPLCRRRCCSTLPRALLVLW